MDAEDEQLDVLKMKVSRSSTAWRSQNFFYQIKIKMSCRF